QRHHAEHARADAVGDRLDRAALACRIAPLEDHDHPQPLFPDPVLESAQLDLQSAELLLVFLALHRFVGGPHRRRLLCVSGWDSSMTGGLHRGPTRRRTSFFASSMRENKKPPSTSIGQIRSGTGPVPNTACNGGA